MMHEPAITHSTKQRINYWLLEIKLGEEQLERQIKKLQQLRMKTIKLAEEKGLSVWLAEQVYTITENNEA